MKVKLFEVRLAEEFVQQDQQELNKWLQNVTIRRTSTELIQSDPKYWSVFLCYEEGIDPKAKKLLVNPLREDHIVADKKPAHSSHDAESIQNNAEEIPLSKIELSRLEALKQWRNETAVKLNLPGYMVTSNATLTNIAKINPPTVETLITIKGLGPAKIERFGNDIISLLNSF